MFLVFATATIFSFAAELKKPQNFNDFQTWYEKGETKSKIQGSKLLSPEEKENMNHDLSRRTRFVEDLLNNETLTKVTKKISTKIDQKDFDSYESLEKIYLNLFKEGIIHNTLDFNEFFKNFKQRISYLEIRDHLGKVNNAAYSLVLLRDIRKFLYNMYYEIEKTLQKNDNKKQLNETLQNLKEYILNLLEGLDTFSIHWFKKLYTSFDIAILEKDVKTNNEEKRRLARLDKEFRDLQKKHNENIEWSKKLATKKEAAEQIVNQKIKSERLKKLEPDFKNLKKSQEEAVKMRNELDQQLQAFTGTLSNKINRYKKSYPSLFDKLVEEYGKEITKVSGNIYSPHQAYQALGLLLWATPDEVEQAYEVRRKSLENASPQEKQAWQGARNASAILRGKEGKKTYDIFLDDFLMLVRLGIDPYFPIKSKVLQNFLNTEGQLACIEISKEVHDEIDPDNPHNLAKKVADLYVNVVKYKDTLENFGK